MSLTKTMVIDRVEVAERGNILVRRAAYVEEDGQRIAGPIFQRTSYDPGANITSEAAKVRAIAAAVWTPAVVAEWQAHLRRVNQLGVDVVPGHIPA